MKKFIFLILTLFLNLTIVSANELIDLEINTTFSKNVNPTKINSYRVTIKDRDGEFKINLDRKIKFHYICENLLENVPSIKTIEIEDKSINYGYIYNTESDDALTKINIYIYNQDKETYKNGQKVTDLKEIYDPVTTETTTKNIVLTKSTISKSTTKIGEKNEELDSKTKDSLNIFFKIVVFIILGVIIVFVIFTGVKMINANK